MSVNTSSRFGVGFQERASDRTEEEREKPRRAEDWAAALAQSVTAQLPRNWAPLAASPEAWRGGDKALTLADPEHSGRAGGGAPLTSASAAGEAAELAEGGDGERLKLTIDGGELGEMSLILDRTKSGLRVTIGVADAAVMNAVGPERAALERALAGAGLSIDSVNVVAQTSIGTVLAQSTRARVRQAAPQPERKEDSDTHRKRAQRKLNLIG